MTAKNDAKSLWQEMISYAKKQDRGRNQLTPEEEQLYRSVIQRWLTALDTMRAEGKRIPFTWAVSERSMRDLLRSSYTTSENIRWASQITEEMKANYKATKIQALKSLAFPFTRDKTQLSPDEERAYQEGLRNYERRRAEGTLPPHAWYPSKRAFKNIRQLEQRVIDQGRIRLGQPSTDELTGEIAKAAEPQPTPRPSIFHPLKRFDTKRDAFLAQRQAIFAYAQIERLAAQGIIAEAAGQAASADQRTAIERLAAEGIAAWRAGQPISVYQRAAIEAIYEPLENIASVLESRPELRQWASEAEAKKRSGVQITDIDEEIIELVARVDAFEREGLEPSFPEQSPPQGADAPSPHAERYCPACGAGNQQSDRFCSKCGGPLPQ